MRILLGVVLSVMTVFGAQWHVLSWAGDTTLKEVQFGDSMQGWTIARRTLHHTTDRGRTWSIERSLVAPHYFGGLAVVDTGQVFVSYGAIYYPHFLDWYVWVDERVQGQWRNRYYNYAQSVQSALQACRFSVLDSEHLWHLGWQGLIPQSRVAVRTRNGGQSWGYFSAVSWSYYDASFTDTLMGWAAWNVVLKTTNSGDSWVTLTVDIGARRVQMLDTLCGWLVTTSGLMGTTDGGVSWTTAVAETGLKALRFCNPRHGVVVGSNGHVLHTTDGGSVWVRDTVETTQGLTAVCMVDSAHAWAGGDGGVVLGMGDWAMSGVDEQWQPLPRTPGLISVWPNPAARTLWLRYIGDAGSVSVYDVCGRPVRTAATHGDCTVQFDLNGLAEGAYFARAVGAGGGATGLSFHFVLLH